MIPYSKYPTQLGNNSPTSDKHVLNSIWLLRRRETHFKDSFLEVPPDVLDRVQTGGEGRPIYRQPDTMLLEPCFNFSGSLYRGVILQANNVGYLLLGRFPVINGW